MVQQLRLDVPLLFTYGTLQLDDVQRNVFGRPLEGRPDTLTGFERSTVPVDDRSAAAARDLTHYPNVVFNGDPESNVEGTVYELTEGELTVADGYEASADYHRVAALLGSGTRAWVYLRRDRRGDAARIFHITMRAAWDAAGGEYTGDTLDSEGFVHCSDPHQVLAVAERRFRGVEGLILLEIDAAKLLVPLRYENLEGGSELFPHVYGPLARDAVVGVHALEIGPSGDFVVPNGVDLGQPTG